MVVIHDFEVQAYRDAADVFQHQFTFKALNPQTGIVWNHERELTKAFRNAASVIKRFVKKIEPDDVRGWMKAFN